MKLKSRQNLVPKASLPAAPAAQRNTRSAEILSLKHFPGGPGRPNLCQQNQNWRLRRKMRALARQIYTKSSSRALRAQALSFQKNCSLGLAFLSVSGFWRRFGLKNLAFCPCFPSSQKPFNKQTVQKKIRFPTFAHPPPPRDRKLPKNTLEKIRDSFPLHYVFKIANFRQSPPSPRPP